MLLCLCFSFMVEKVVFWTSWIFIWVLVLSLASCDIFEPQVPHLSKHSTAIHSSWNFPGRSDGKESTHNAKDLVSVPRLGRSPGEENGNLLQCSCLVFPWMEESGELQSMGSKRVKYDWVTSTFTFSYSSHSKCCFRNIFLVTSSW